MAIFRFLQDGRRRHLDFLNFKFLTVGALKRAKLHHHVTFRRNRSNRGRDMLIFSIFKDGGRRHLDF